MFYSHHLYTMEGGVTVTDDEELYHFMLCFRAHGWTRNLPTNSNLYVKKENDFYESFNFIVLGFNLRPLEIEAAVGMQQFQKLDSIITQKKLNVKYLQESMSGISGVRTQKEVESSS